MISRDLATLLECVNGDAYGMRRHRAALANVKAEVARLTVKCAFPSCVEGEKPEWCGRCGDAQRAEAAETEVARLGRCLTLETERAIAAEGREFRLRDGLRRLENAVRIFDVMLNEPAAKGLMSAEDYQTYFRGAWLGVDEAAEQARSLLADQDGAAHDERCAKCGLPRESHPGRLFCPAPGGAA